MEQKQKVLLQALADAERMLEKMQKTKKTDLDKIRKTYEKELTKIENQNQTALTRALNDVERANERALKSEKANAEKTELVRTKTRELFEMREALTQEQTRAAEAEKALSELKNQVQVLQSQNQNGGNNQTIQSQLTELLTTTRMAPIYEILSRLPSNPHYPMSPVLGEQLAQTLPQYIQPQQSGMTGEILSAINSLRTEQDNVNARIEALLDEHHPSQQQEYRPQPEHEQFDEYEQQTQFQGQKLDDIVTETVAPAEVSIDALATSLESAIEEKNGSPIPYQLNPLGAPENNESLRNSDGSYESLDEIINNLNKKNTEETDQF